MIIYLSLLFQKQLCRGLSGKLIKFLPKLPFGPYIWETVDNVTGAVGKVFSFHLRATQSCSPLPFQLSLHGFCSLLGHFHAKTWLFFFAVPFGPYLTMWIPVSSSPFLLQPCNALWRVSWCSSQSSFHPGFSRIAHTGNRDRCQNLSSDWI